MVWVCITFKGDFRLCFIDGILNGQKYVEILKCKLFGLTNFPYIYQQDNYPSYTSRVCQNWFKKNGINALFWPLKSPDLNII